MPPQPITLGDLESFAIDEENRLYWNGNVIKTEADVKLTDKQARWAGIVAAAAIASALFSGLYTATYLYATFWHPSTPPVVIVQQPTPDTHTQTQTAPAPQTPERPVRQPAVRP